MPLVNTAEGLRFIPRDRPTEERAERADVRAGVQTDILQKESEVRLRAAEFEQGEKERKAKVAQRPIFVDDLTSTNAPEGTPRDVAAFSPKTRGFLVDYARTRGFVESDLATGREFITAENYDKAQASFDDDIGARTNAMKIESAELSSKISQLEATLLSPEFASKAKPEQVKVIQNDIKIAKQMKNGIDQGLMALAPKEFAAGKGAVPTDIDDFVARANQESINITGEPLTAGQQNEAALKFKRAQAEEVEATEFARKNVDATTAERIAFNSEKGKQLAIIETAGDVLEARGEVTPQAKKNIARKGVSGKLATLGNHYLNLNSMNAIVNVDNPTPTNILAAGRASEVGQFFGRITGTDAQSIRNSISKLRPLLLQDIRQSTDMGARGLDSEKELEFYLQAATDTKTDIQSNIAAMVVLDEAYGEGLVAEQLRDLTDESLIKRISGQGQFILQGGTREGGIPTGPKVAPSGLDATKRARLEELRRKKEGTEAGKEAGQ